MLSADPACGPSSASKMSKIPSTKILNVFEQRVYEEVTRLGFEVSPASQIGGYQPDFVLKSKDGRTIVLEVKGWAPDEIHLHRARHQVKLYQSALGADAGFIVLPQLATGIPEQGILSLRDLYRLPDLIASQDERKLPGEVVGSPTPDPSAQRIVFAAMPFAAEFDDVFFYAMTYAANAVGAACMRVDRDDFSGDVVEHTRALINRSIAVIADLSGSRPNVLFELGYAQGVSRPTVHICSTSLADMPFDVRNWNVLEYSTGQTHKLREALAKRLKAVLGAAQKMY